MLQHATTLHHFTILPPCINHAYTQALWLQTYQRHSPEAHPLLYWLSIRKLKVLHQCDPERSICAPNTKQQRRKQALRVYWQIGGIYGKKQSQCPPLADVMKVRIHVSIFGG